MTHNYENPTERTRRCAGTLIRDDGAVRIGAVQLRLKDDAWVTEAWLVEDEAQGTVRVSVEEVAGRGWAVQLGAVEL